LFITIPKMCAPAVSNDSKDCCNCGYECDRPTTTKAPPAILLSTTASVTGINGGLSNSTMSW
jgi:hypothetical protein